MNENDKPKKSFPKKIVVLISCLSVVGLMAAAVIMSFLLKEPPAPQSETKADTDLNTSKAEPNAESRVEIVPTQNTPEGIEIDTEFIVRTNSPMKISELAECLSLKNDETYTLRESGTESEYIMSFNSPLQYDAIYRIEFADRDERPVSFAFQTVEGFKITSTTPGGNNAYSIPLNSGIEITFNERIEGDFKDYFEITPFVNGKFENVGNTYIFISDGFLPNTPYNVVVRQGLQSAESGRILEEDYKFDFYTQWSDLSDSVSIRGDAYETFLPDDEVFVELFATGVFLEKSYGVEIYELETSEAYLNAQKILKDSPEIISEMDCITALETELFVVKNDSYYNSYSYVMLNQKLPDGWYIVKITTENEGKNYDLYKFIQVSPIAVYSAAVDGEMLFWINDVNTGLPASGAEITLRQEKVTADKDGLAVITTPESITESVTVNYGDYPAFVYMTNSRAPAVLDASKRYYHYVYTDRKAYKPTDTIDLFGVIRERYGEYKITPNDKVAVKIGNMTEIPVTLDKYGSFYVKIPITGMKGYLSLNLYFNGEIMDSDYINIVDYDNAKYMIDAKTDRPAYRPGERASVEISAATYDGTSAEGLEIMRSGATVAKTDKNGIATVTEYAQNDSWNKGWQPYTRSFYYDIGKTENKIQYIGVPYIFIPSDIMLEHEIISDGEISFASAYIDRDKIEKGVGDSWYSAYNLSPDLYRGAPADINFTVEIYKSETIRTKTGDRYDYINKVNVPLYKYSTSTAVASVVHHLKTADGRASISGLPLSGFISDDVFVNYYAVVSYNDTEGNQIQFNISYGSGWNYNNAPQSSIKNYYFNFYNDKNEKLYNLRLGETGYVKLIKNDYYYNYYFDGNNAPEITEGSILAALVHAKNNIISTTVGSPDGTPVTFTEDCIYNALVIGAYFDGRHIYPILYGREIRYDYAEKTLDIDISFDKETYEPGDEVTAEIKMTDENGNPKKGLVNISVVDESVFAEYQNNPNMPSRYYSGINSYISYSYYASYTQHEFLNGGGAEMGGGGGDDYMMRKDFADNPAFISVETDESGIVRITFKLADKITSWRVTVHGVTDDDYVGNEKENIISTLPFAFDLVMNDEYIAGDDIAILVKPQGNEFDLDKTEVTYDVLVLSGGNPAVSGTGTSKGNFSFNGGKLPEGDYTVSVKAEAKTDGGTFRDGMEKEISVIKSGALLQFTATDIISETNPTLREYDVKLSPVRVRMSNYDTHFITNILYSCVDYSSRRTDYAAANVFARKFEASIYNKTPLNISPSDYVGADLGPSYPGSKSELIYGGFDILYTARFYACFPETSDNNKENIRDFVYNSSFLYINKIKGLKNMTPEFTGNAYAEQNRAAGYLTLAAIGDSVLLDIYKQIDMIYHSANQNKFTESYDDYMRVLYYAAALCTLGDDNGARELMKRYQFNFNSQKFASLDRTARDKQTEYINTLTLYVNTRIDPDAAYEYLKEKQDNKYVSDVCEKINFIRYFTFKGGTRSEIEYTLDGATLRAVLNNRDMLQLDLTKEQFEALNIKQISGNTAINLSFYGSPDNFDADKEEIYFEKQILSSEEFGAHIGNSKYSGIAADKSAYYVVLKFKVPDGTPLWYHNYTICDRLPGNMRYINSGISYGKTTVDRGNYYSISNPEKQFVNLNVSVYAKGGDEITVVYNEIRINDADAVVEKAYISRDFDVDGIWGVSK